MTTAAIILHYWLERTENIKRIIHDLKGGTVVPDKIIVFNNNRDFVFPPLSGVIVINSGHNFHCLVRHALGLLVETEFCLFVDDDLTLQPDGLEYLLDMHQSFPHSILGFFGRCLGNDEDLPYISARIIGDVREPTPVDIVLGRVHFCRREKLVNSFVLREGMRKNLGVDPLIDGERGDDILLSLSNVSPDRVAVDDILLSLSNVVFGGGENFVLPSKAKELSEAGVGYHYMEDHYTRRNEVCKRILEYERSVHLS